MKATLLWTINDFPARSSLSGWSGQGYYACPTCNGPTPSWLVKNTKSLMLVIEIFKVHDIHKGSKFKDYYGSKEPTPKPRKFSELEIQLQISKVLKRRPGKHPDIAKKNPKPNREIELNWSKRSIFWDLEYWPFLKLKHNLDVMHIEKNALEALLNTLLQKPERQNQRHGKGKAKLGNFESSKGVVVVSVCVPVRMQTDTGRMKATRLTTDVRLGQLLWLYLTTVLKSTLDILAYSEKSPDNVETNFPAVRSFNTMGLMARFNDDNANANEGNAEDDVYAHVLDDDDDDVVVSDDDEVNPSTNVEEMACVFPRSHGGDAGGSPPRRPNRPVPAQCESSNLRIETGNASLRRAFRQNGQRPLTIGFDYGDLGTFHPTGDYSSMLNSLMGETVKYLPLACEWEEIPEAYKAHIFPTLESYFDLASWYNNQDKVVMGNNVYTVGDRVKLGLQLKLRILWRKNKQRIKADHFTRYGSAEEARNHLPPKKVWGDRTEDEWNNLVDWWSHPDRVARSLQNAANRAKNTILTHQGKKSFAQGRNEYKVQKGHYEDLIETWRKTHSRPETGEFKTQKNLKRYLDMKSMQDQVRAGVIPYKTDQDILDEVVPSTNRQNMSGKGRKLPGGGSTSRRRGPQAFPDVISREEMDRILRQRDQEAELLRKQTAEAQQRAYLAALKADAAYQNSETMYGAIGEYFSNYAPNPTRPFMPPAFARPTMPQLSPEWAHLLNPPFPYNQPLQPSYAGPSQYTGPPGYTGPPRYTAPLQPLQPPYVGQFPFTPVNNNTFNNCYNPVMNSNLASTSNSRPELPRFIINPHNNDTRSVDELARDRELAGEDNDVGDNEEADSQQSSGDYSEDEEGDNEEVQDESEESD
ncbi:Myc-type, basic helix-loop-helix domain-containing protein [Tanacetum coccineum]